MKNFLIAVLILLIVCAAYVLIASHRRQTLEQSYNCEVNGYTCSQIARCWGRRCNPSIREMIGVEPVKTDIKTPKFVEYRLPDGRILKTPFMLTHNILTDRKVAFLTVIYPDGNLQKFNGKGRLLKN